CFEGSAAPRSCLLLRSGARGAPRLRSAALSPPVGRPHLATMVYDLVIIGGGINGAGTARDAALRGMSVALFEREDWGSGTTGGSTRMVHGGMRYLLYDIPTTRLSSEDAGRIRGIAPHVTWRIPFLWPLFPGSRFMREATEAFLSAY